MTTPRYYIENGNLIIRDDSNNQNIWQSTFETPIIQVFPLQKQQGCLIVCDSSVTNKQTFENLLKITPKGKIVWTAELPCAHDAYVEIIEAQDIVVAQTWNGYLVELDSKTGKIKSSKFVK